MLRDNEFRKLLAQTLGAQVVCIMGDGSFEVVSHKPLPNDLSQLSVKYTVTTQSSPQTVIGHHMPVDVVMNRTYSYWFHPAAQPMLHKVLAHELEKKRYEEFSKTFDKEVQSELEQ